MGTVTNRAQTLKLQDIIEITTLSRSTILRMVKKGHFPPHVTIGGTSLWRKADVDQWVQKNIVEPIEQRKKELAYQA